MHRPFTRRQAAQNDAFLAALRRTGNVRLAARELGVHRAAYTKRRAKSAAFAAQWEAALADADRSLRNERPAYSPGDGEGNRRQDGGGAPLPRTAPPPLRTRGGEPHLVRTAAGRLQRRAAPPGRMTQAALRRVLDLVAETNNLRLAAAEAGVALPTLIARARRSPAFAEALRIAKAVARARIRDAECRAAERARARPVVAYAGGPWPDGMTLHDAMLVVQHQRAREEGRPPGPRRRPARAAAIAAVTMEEVAAAIDAAIELDRRRARAGTAGTWRLEGEPLPPYAAHGAAAAAPPPPDPDARPARRH
jgi:hypothetical protein